MSRDILESPQVTRFAGAASLELTEPDKSRTCYQFNESGLYVQYTRADALRVAFAILIEESDKLPSAISSSFVSILMLVKKWWAL